MTRNSHVNDINTANSTALAIDRAKNEKLLSGNSGLPYRVTGLQGIKHPKTTVQQQKYKGKKKNINKQTKHKIQVIHAIYRQSAAEYTP